MEQLENTDKSLARYVADDIYSDLTEFYYNCELDASDRFVRKTWTIEALKEAYRLGCSHASSNDSGNSFKRASVQRIV